MVAMARTGSGKTAAFLIPLFERLKSHSPQVREREEIMKENGSSEDMKTVIFNC